ncbi:hypothetical protein Q8A67_023079 [Cirrhinus molitorella]|uniref:Uncharacterized protein n=1 Tax=Cirrhinus molitorella TaxID=172907 RepID=A0AA88TCQ4_9TELE|nr:hypothetical protein Q8A67_023079 [Cirrhinus molitorella]
MAHTSKTFEDLRHKYASTVTGSQHGHDDQSRTSQHKPTISQAGSKLISSVEKVWKYKPIFFTSSAFGTSERRVNHMACDSLLLEQCLS